MGLFDLFKRKAAQPQLAVPTAVDYVEWLLEYMVRASRTELTIATDAPLPDGGSGEPNPPPCLPETQLVINRLKILAKLPPVRQEQAAEGAFEHLRGNLSLCLKARFSDTSGRSSCRLQMELRPTR